MSRPFSYNDENFTVIGNILFVHFNDVLERKANEPIIEVPPEIFKRLYGYTNIVSSSLNEPSSESENFPITIVEKNGKHYIAFHNPRYSTTHPIRHHYCYYLLKDI